MRMMMYAAAMENNNAGFFNNPGGCRDRGRALRRQMQRMALRSMAESEGEKLAAIGNAFRQVGTREDFEQMGELARDAYLRYQFERCYPEGYGLIKDGACIANRTAYEILNPRP